MATTPPTLPTDPCALLAYLQNQMILLAGGQGVVVIETPQLGRVEFNQANLGQLQRVIDQVAAQCAAASGTTTTTGTQRRGPINLEAWP